MFDKTFFRFVIGFSVIIMLSLGALYIAGYFKAESSPTQRVFVR